MEITTVMIKELKEKTGAGIVDCKQVLQETGGDMEKAVEILNKKGLAKAAKKEGRAANDGCVVFKIEGKKGLVLKVNCETDFVAKTDNFKSAVNQMLELIFLKGFKFSAELPEEVESIRKSVIAKLGENILVSDWKFINQEGELYSYSHLGKVAVIADLIIGNNKKDDAYDQMVKNIAMQITAMNPVGVDAASIPADKIAEITKKFNEEAKATGKPEKVIENIIKGKLEKFYNESVLMEQVFILDEEKKVKDILAPYIKSGFCIKSFVRSSL